MQATTAGRRRLDRVYGAIADPTRRAILATLAGGEVTVGRLAAQFPMTFNAVSKHVKVLEHAGLLRRRVQGREHHLRLDPRPLRDAAGWLEHYREFWELRLDAPEALLTGAAAGGEPGVTRREARTGTRRRQLP